MLRPRTAAIRNLCAGARQAVCAAHGLTRAPGAGRQLIQVDMCDDLVAPVLCFTCGDAASACLSAAAASTASTSNLAKVAAVRNGDVVSIACSAGAASSTTSGSPAQAPTRSSNCRHRRLGRQ